MNPIISTTPETSAPVGPAVHTNGRKGPDFAAAVTEKIRALSGRQANWDGYGAPPIDTAVIESACRFVSALPEGVAGLPRVTPMSSGVLQLEWHDGGRMLELEFETAATIHFLQWDPANGVEAESTFPVTDVDRAVELIRWFTGGCGR